MIKIAQFGEGNFLRTFVDYYFDVLNNESGKRDFGVTIIKPIPLGSLDKFYAQNNKYNIVLRGVADGKASEKVYKVNSLDGVIDPFNEIEKFYALAVDPELKIVVSNTTEAGICFNGDDDICGFEKITYPAKLTKFLLERFKAGLSGVYMMPVELIDNNATELYNCVKKYVKLWNLSADFEKWIDGECYFLNTLVDRIVSGHPKTEEDKKHIEEVIGYKDELVSIGEPFGLWAVENKGDIKNVIKEDTHGIDVVITDNIGYYKKRKVRVLNGSHTNLVPVGLWLGEITVYDCMKNERLNKFLSDTLTNEIIPFVSDDIAATTKFADSVKERFLNPYLNHELISISLNSISKWRARDLPSFKNYYEKFGKIPDNLTIGFSYLMAIYSSVYKKDGKYFVNLPTRAVEIKDDIEYLEYFVNGGDVAKFMKNEKVFGENLDCYCGFIKAVEENVKAVKSGKNLI